jgi:hypothetical protein
MKLQRKDSIWDIEIVVVYNDLYGLSLQSFIWGSVILASQDGALRSEAPCSAQSIIILTRELVLEGKAQYCWPPH